MKKENEEKLIEFLRDLVYKIGYKSDSDDRMYQIYSGINIKKISRESLFGRFRCPIYDGKILNTSIEEFIKKLNEINELDTDNIDIRFNIFSETNREFDVANIEIDAKNLNDTYKF